MEVRRIGRLVPVDSEPGAGVALIRRQGVLDKLAAGLSGDEKTGVTLMRRVFEEPLIQIADNAGAEGTVVVDAVQKNADPEFGYDAMNNR